MRTDRLTSTLREDASTPANADDHRPPSDPAPAGVASLLPSIDPDAALALPRDRQWDLFQWLLAVGRDDEATALLDAIDDEGRTPVRVTVERARLASRRGRLAEACDLLRARHDERPSATSRHDLVRALLEAGDLAEAEALLESAVDDTGNDATARLLAADLARARGDLAGAGSILEAVAADDPGNRTVRFALAGVRLRQNRPDDVLALVDLLLDGEAPLSPTQSLATAALLDAVGRPARATTLRAAGVRAEADRLLIVAERLRQALGLTGDALGPAAHRDAPLPPDAEAANGPIDASGRLDASSTADPRSDFPAGPDAPPVVSEAQPSSPAAPDREPEPVPDPEPEPEPDPAVVAKLDELFGHPAFRPNQWSVVRRVLAGEDTLAILPTGAGKSLTYQLPAMLLDGVTLVLSPLIALMKDQVEGLPPAVRERTAYLNSTLTAEEQRAVMGRLVDGDLKLVYAAPERLRQGTFLAALRQANLARVVVDEAHCISLWGHDFRPDYLGIPHALAELGNPPLLAVTATATPEMARAIEQQFGRDLTFVRGTAFRPNLTYEVRHAKNREEKLEAVLEIAREERGAGIVYVSSRDDAERIATLLRRRGVDAVPYHAGLPKEQRDASQERFMSGRARVVVATVAFGMGVDKPDVRFIIHVSPSLSLEAYAQESGRAGRDGLPSRCVMLATKQDQTSLKRLAARDQLDLADLRAVYARVMQAAKGRWASLDARDLARAMPLTEDGEDRQDPRLALNLLAQGRLLRRHPDAPAEVTVRRIASAASASDAPSDLVDRFAAWSDLGPHPGATVVAGVPEACDALGCTPFDLLAALTARPDLDLWERGRDLCYELLPTGNDAKFRLESVLARSKAAADSRVNAVFAYVNSRECRHVVIARHLGDRIAPCGDACDVCLGLAATTPEPRAQRERSSRPDPVADALAVLAAMPTLPFSVGKTGLVNLLLGSVESSIRPDRSAAFGALEHRTKNAIGKTVDRLVETGYLERDMDHEYKLISLTRKGRGADAESLSADAFPGGRPPGSATDTGAIPADVDADLLAALKQWRGDQSRERGVSAFVVASNRALEGIAAVYPTSEDALLQVPGIGRGFVDRYGPEILRLIADHAES